VSSSDLRVDGKIILKMVLQEMGWGDFDWVELVQYKERWRALVTAVVNYRFQ
jgi:hypothetical protein